MKKYIIYISFTFILLLLCISTNSEASSGSTVFIGEPVILNDYNNIEITHNKVDINEETSEISNIQLFTNLSNEKIVKKASIKLEDSYCSLTINSLKIKVNDLEIENFEKIEDEYIFYFEILPNEGKKIEISYKTDSDLQNAKIIKYSMDKLKGKDVKLFQINVKLSKYDIPLVQKIWPGAYEYDFENYIVSTEYFDFKVNNLTSQFIIEKETYKNLKYGDYAEKLTEIDEYVLNHIKDIMDGNHGQIQYSNYYQTETIDSQNTIANWIYGRDWDRTIDKINYTFNDFLDYALFIDAYNNNRLVTTTTSGKKHLVIRYNPLEYFCLADLIYNTYSNNYNIDYNYPDERHATGKMVAINYYESEQGKDLYVNKDTTNNTHSVDTPKEAVVLMKRDEYSILRTRVTGGEPKDFNAGMKRVYVNSDIDGNKIDITEEEIIEFVNMMNIDLYIRIVIYDPSESYPSVRVGYYSNETKKIASEYNQNLESSFSFYQVKLFDNEIVKNNCKVPVVAHCVGICTEQDGKYVIDFNSAEDLSGLIYVYGASECDVAKKMLEENKNINDTKRNEILNKITTTKVNIDTEEYIHQKEEIQNENNIQQINSNKNDNIINSITKDPIILGAVITIFVLTIVLIIYIIIKIIRRKKNGRE